MNARKKLNVAYFQGTVVLAAVAGVLAKSTAVFLVTLVILIAGALYAGEIRPHNKR